MSPAPLGALYVSQPSWPGVAGPPFDPTTSWLMYGLPVRVSTPEMTAKPLPITAPPSAIPNPSPTSENECWMMLIRRSATLVVASEQLVGCTGTPTTQLSRSSTSIRRNAPEFTGMSFSSTFSTPLIALLVEHARDSLMPTGRQSMLSRRSIEILASSGSTVTAARKGIPSTTGPNGSWPPFPTTVPAGSRRMAWIIRRSE